MNHPHLLDRRLGPDWPDLSTAEGVAALEAVPYAERIAAASVYEALRLGMQANPSAPAITFLPGAKPDDTAAVLSHEQFFARVTQAANAFTALGVGPKDVVSLLLPLLPQSFIALFGAETAGIANPVNPLIEPYQIAEILQAAGAKVIVTLGPLPGTDLWDKTLRLLPEVPGLSAVVAIAGASVANAAPGSKPADGSVPIYDFDALVAAQPADRLTSGRTIAASDPVAYYHTGGTTGTPKLVRHTHRNHVHQAWSFALMQRLEPGDAVLYGMPLFHVGGALSQALTWLASGGHLVVLSPVGWRNPAAVQNIWQLVERYRPSCFSGVPTVLAAALQMPREGRDLSSLRSVASGGAAVPLAVGQAYEKMGLSVLEIYGMTETSSVHMMAYTDRPIRIGSVGFAMPYNRVRVVNVDAAGKAAGDCATGEIGVVIMSGPGVFSGYVSEKHNKEAFAEPGWVNSGDLGRFDTEGYLWITGRAKDLVIRGGHNIDPQPIEDILFSHPAVALAAMVGQPDAYAGELPVAYVQLKPGQSAQPDELIGWIRERTPERAAVPVAVHVIETMPQTAVGKLFKPALRWDAARRVAEKLLADSGIAGAHVQAGAHPLHGSQITITVPDVPLDQRESLAERIRERLGPLTMRHEVQWR